MQPYIEIPEMPRTFEQELRNAASERLRMSIMFQRDAALSHRLGDLQNVQAMYHLWSVTEREFGQFLNMLADIEAERKAYWEEHIANKQRLKDGLADGSIKLMTMDEALAAITGLIAGEEQANGTKH